MVRACSTFLFIAASACASDLVDVPELGLRVAPGFDLTRYADNALAPDIYSMTLDPAGRVVISSRGYIKRLHDADGDGRADGDELIAKSGAGAMGMLFLDATTLLTTEGGSFNRYTDSDGDGRIDPQPERIAKFGGGEHGVHGIRSDSEGNVYLIGGNGSKFRGNPKIAAEQRDGIEGGALLRFPPDLSEAVVICHGLRNPYDFDIDSGGETFAYDSDCEREFFLPWYSPTRLYRIEPGVHHGWRLPGYKRGWKRPDYYPDCVRPLVNVGRGSPTGVLVYRHSAFPAHFRDGVFYCDWTFGRVYFTAPDAELEFPGSASAEVFIESAGSNGFAPTDIVLAKDGSLFLSMGGRGTSGSVFHVQARRPTPGAAPIPMGKPAFERLMEPPRGGFDAAAAEATATELETAILEEGAEARMALLRALMVALGDWNLQKPSVELFTGYELGADDIFEPKHEKLLIRCRNTLRVLLHSLNDDERREAARLLAMVRDKHPITASRLLDSITQSSPPTDDFHYLTCLARVTAPLNEDLTNRAAGAILALDAKVAGKQMRSKQTYVDRLNEMVAALAERAPIYPALLADGGLAQPNYASVAAVFPATYRGEIASIFLRAIAAAPAAGWREDSIELLAPLLLAETEGVLRELAKGPLVAPACAKLLGVDPKERDRALYLATGSLAALEKLAPKADAENLIPLFRSLDGNRALSLIARAAGREFVDRAAAEFWLREAKPEIALALGLAAPGEKVDWPALFAKVDWESGNASKGVALFAARGCATCHASASALGPDLSGAAQRLSPADLFTAIVLPNANVPEAYRATVFTMRDGTTHVGRIAFSSADGRIVQTASVTIRLPEDDIVKQDEWSRSLMPEGLLSGLGRGDLADLFAYLKTL